MNQSDVSLESTVRFDETTVVISCDFSRTKVIRERVHARDFCTTLSKRWGKLYVYYA